MDTLCQFAEQGLVCTKHNLFKSNKNLNEKDLMIQLSSHDRKKTLRLKVRIKSMKYMYDNGLKKK